MWMLSGNFSRSAFESNGNLRNRKLGGEHGGRRQRTPRRQQKRQVIVFMVAPLISRPTTSRLLRIQEDLLRAPRRNFRDEELVRIAAVDLVDGAEFSQSLAGLAELADDRAVELHLVDLTGDGPRRRGVGVGIGVRHEQVLVRARRDADGPRVADVVVDRAAASGRCRTPATRALPRSPT